MSNLWNQIDYRNTPRIIYMIKFVLKISGGEIEFSKGSQDNA